MNFIAGIELNKGFYEDVVKKLMEKHYPDLNYSAALIGYGSDVMGYDTVISMDHMWGPRLYIFLSKEDKDLYEHKLMDLMRNALPYSYKGFSTNYSDPDESGISSMEMINSGPIRPLIWIRDLDTFVSDTVGFKWQSKPSISEWLMATDQKLIEMTKGEVYHDGLGTLSAMRDSLNFYPDDVVRMKLISMWHYIANEVAFVGRNRDLKQIMSVKTIAARLVDTMMRMCFYMESNYVPYSKWLGRAFADLECYELMAPIFSEILTSNDCGTIEEKLCEAYLALIGLQNKLGLTDPVTVKASDYYGRPYQVVFTEAIQEALRTSVKDQSYLSLNLDLIAVLQISSGISLSTMRTQIKF